MFAVTAVSLSPDDPLSGLATGEHPDPEPPLGWEVVEVRAASLNHHDLWTLRGVGMSQDRLPTVLGCDAAGVTADGREVIVHAVIATADGDETLADDFSILSERYPGTFAERVAVPRRNLVDKPAQLDFNEAACLPTAYLTAYRALFTRADAEPGQTVLIQGAGGGVATAAILLGAASGLRVWVTSRSDEKRAAAEQLGAHASFEAGAKLPERVDIVLESVGEATWEHSLKVLRPGGTIVVVGATSGAEPSANLRRVFYRQIRVVGSSMGTRDELASLARLLAVTGTRPLIDGTYDLRSPRPAFERLLEGDVVGKLVLTND